MPWNQLMGEIRACQKCARSLARYGVCPRPISSEGADYPIMLLGQAPGKTEYQTGQPFQGSAGQAIRALFRTCGVEDFDALIYQTSVMKCFPGRLPSASSDRAPSAAEVKNCAPFLTQQLKLLRPRLLVCLGSLAWRAYVQAREAEEPGYRAREFGSLEPRRLGIPEFVGRRFQWNGCVVIPMIHPAGTANGARAKYPEQDAASKALLKTELAALNL